MNDDFMKKEVPKTEQQFEEQKEISKEVDDYFFDLGNEKDRPTILNLNCRLKPSMFRDYYDNVYYLGNSPQVPDHFIIGSVQHKCWLNIMQTLTKATSDQNCRIVISGKKIQGTAWSLERRNALIKLNEVRKELYKKLEIIYDKIGQKVYLDMILTMFKYDCYSFLLMSELY